MANKSWRFCKTRSRVTVYAFSAPEPNPSDETPPVNDNHPNPSEPAPTKPKFTEEQQSFINDIVARESRKSADKAVKDALAARDEEAEKERKRIMRETLKEQQNFEALADGLQKEIDDLKDENTRLRAENESMRESSGKYNELVLDEYKAFVESMPGALRMFDPGDDASIEEKRGFIDRAKKAQAELGEPFRPPVPLSPAPITGAQDHTSEERARDHVRRNPAYNRISM